MRLTVVAHFYNEAFLLPYWLSYHSKIFDHGILIDRYSTDNSVEIIREITPHWEVRISRNRLWDFIEADREVMEIEREIDDWKMVLNITEFILHANLREYLDGFKKSNPNLFGVRTNGIVMVDKLEDRYKELTMEHLILQKNYGYLESDYAPITPTNPLHRSRFIHYASDGQYALGRHRTSHASILDKNLFLLWFGFCPFQYIKKRKLSFKKRLSPRTIAMGAGLQHTWSEEELESAFLKETARSYNLLEKIPEYAETIEDIKLKFTGL